DFYQVCFFSFICSKSCYNIYNIQHFRQLISIIATIYKYKHCVPLNHLQNEQLSLFDGSRPSKGVYLAILGRVYNVENGRKHYAPGGGYHFFAGRDATRAFVSGDFSEAGLVDDVTGFEYQDLLAVLDWINFYEKSYELIGVLRGRYYDKNGRPTEQLQVVNKALRWKDLQAKETEIFPPCNSEWHSNVGGRVWCSSKSGGVHRDWIGVPRKLFSSSTKSYRCACVKNFGPPLSLSFSANEKGNRGDLDNPNLREYPGCKPTSNSCKLEKE
uniref:Cytochrome b5 heme-binding domain-containing protein n=1 Tax=Syphacia muris TaxID=451379 RepID=A0A0N5AJZ3_9BILA